MLAARNPPSGAVANRSSAVRSDGYAYAHRIIHTVCCLAGAASFVDDAHDNLVNEGVLGAIEAHNTPVLFDWMVRGAGSTLSWPQRLIEPTQTVLPE